MFAAWADPTVSDVIVNQRWPWSEKVDVDFTLTGGPTDVRVTAVWDGRDEPCELGTVCEAKPGQNRFTWDPAASPFAGRALAGFSVTLTTVAPPADRYLVIDLADGGVAYRAVPDGTDGRWTDTYKTSKMVFRRIPAGTYQLGMESNVIARAFGADIGSGYATAWKRHDVVFTSDFYVGVFKMTNGQYDRLAETSSGDPLHAKFLSYDEIRGPFSANGLPHGVNWPKTEYDVVSTSLVAKLRAKAGAVDFKVDLCQECQWEAAMRAGKTTVWPNGGTMEDSLSAWTNIVDAIGWRGKGSALQDVGQKADTGWGIYDAIGIAPDWTLDFATSTGKSTLPNSGLSDATDPIGGKTDVGAKRVIRGSGDSKLYYRLPCVRQVTERENATATARFCIHLTPLKSN